MDENEITTIIKEKSDAIKYAYNDTFDIPSIHRVTIDSATRRSVKKHDIYYRRLPWKF